MGLVIRSRNRVSSLPDAPMERRLPTTPPKKTTRRVAPNAATRRSRR